MTGPDDILHFWFPPGLDADEETHRRQFQWWFKGGADAAILQHYVPTWEAAVRGELEAWAEAPRWRLALILVLDQFSRTIRRGQPQAFAQHGTAQQLALDGIERGFYGQLPAVWEKTFFSIPLSHSESIALHDRNVALCAALVDEAPARLRRLYEFSAAQCRAHREVVARFGRHPHRNAILGRPSTEAELAYLAADDLVHQRSFQPG